ncbi:MAG TPA: acetoacetate--CoA ligase [Alphaproteobacteria bacterium]
MVQEGELLWTPGKAFVENSMVARFTAWLRAHRGLDFTNYDELWRWSVEDLEGFWSAIWAFFEIESTTPYERVLDRRVMPGARWFEGSRVNFAEHVLRHERADPDGLAIQHMSELRPLARMSWRELGRQVRTLATRLRAMGIQPGDRVVSYMPNLPETVIAMLATAAAGGIWASAAPEFGVKTVLDRFTQIEPRFLFAADGYRFGGKDYDRVDAIKDILANVPSVEHVIWFPYLRPERADRPVANAVGWQALMDAPEVPRETFAFEHVPWDHPLWILFSSGTTGLPKPIVHGHVGILVECLKCMSFHFDLKPGGVLFFYSTTGWMMFNALICALLTRASVVLYDGHPAHPAPDLLWEIVAKTGATCFGASPAYVQAMQKQGLVPKERHDLSRLESVLLIGSPSTPESFAWFYRSVKDELWVTSQSGGTDICSGLVGAVPGLPVYAGEIQTRLLGMDVHAWSDDGKELIDEVGELVVTSPSPSMPLYFWNDADGTRYRDSYFAKFPGVWCHGDLLRINRRGGCFVYGRSDATLNRKGVRIGSAEIYRALDRIDGIFDSLVVCVEQRDGSSYMPLFVQLRDGVVLDEAFRARIAETLRRDCSPRHVPDRIHQVAAIPYTLTGKKMEVPVKRLLMGWPLDKVASRDSMRDPAAMDWFVRYAEEHRPT